MPEANSPNPERTDVQCIESDGAWPFRTRKVFRLANNRLHHWSSRHHRKGLTFPAKSGRLLARLRGSLWAPAQLNWWIGIIFAIGSALFIAGSLLCLFPEFATLLGLSATQVNGVFFAGSIPFTTAAYLQLFQAANAPDQIPTEMPAPRRRTVIIGWKPHDAGWLSSALQFVGTILFNFNTFDAMLPGLNWWQQDMLIWTPNIVGSILFLISGYLAFIEMCHAHWKWLPRDLSWWVVFTNLLGCVGFMVSAILAIYLPNPVAPIIADVSIAFTLQGAIGFLIGSLLMLPEMALEND